MSQYNDTCNALGTTQAAYQLTEASGNAADSSGNTLTLTVSGSPTYSITGDIDGAIRTASGSYFRRTSDLGLNLANDWTMLFRFKAVSTPGDNASVFGFGRSDDGGNYVAFFYDSGAGQYRFWPRGAANGTNFLAGAFADNTWHGVALRYKSSTKTISVFKNGVNVHDEVLGDVLGDLASLNTFCLGNLDRAGDTTTFKGDYTIDDFRLLSVAATDGDLVTITSLNFSLTAAVISVGSAPNNKTYSQITINSTGSTGGTAPRTDQLVRGPSAVFFNTNVTSPDTTVVAGTTYYYKLTTTDADANYVESNVVSAVARPPWPEPASYDANGYANSWPLNSGDSAIAVYVSTSGNNANSGLDSAHAKQTLAAAIATVTSARGDQLLLKRGDTWAEVLTNVAISGKNESYPFLIGTYGTGNSPVIDNSSLATGISFAAAVKFVTVQGVDVICKIRNPADGSYDSTKQSSDVKGFSGSTGNVGIRFIDCTAQFQGTGWDMNSFGSDSQAIWFDRCKPNRSYGGSSGSTFFPASDPHAHGVFIERWYDVRFTDYQALHCGWNEHSSVNAAQTLGTVTASPATTTTTCRVTIAVDKPTGWFNGCTIRFLANDANGAITASPNGGRNYIISAATRVDATHQDLIFAAAFVAPTSGQRIEIVDRPIATSSPSGATEGTCTGTTTVVTLTMPAAKDVSAGVWKYLLMLNGPDVGRMPQITSDVRVNATTRTLTLSATDVNNKLLNAPTGAVCCPTIDPATDMGRRGGEGHGIYSSSNGNVRVTIDSGLFLESAASDGQLRSGARLTSCTSLLGNSGFPCNSADANNVTVVSRCAIFEPVFGDGAGFLLYGTTGTTLDTVYFKCSGMYGNDHMLVTIADKASSVFDIGHYTIDHTYGYGGASYGSTTTTNLTSAVFHNGTTRSTQTPAFGIANNRVANFGSGKIIFRSNRYLQLAGSGSGFFTNNFGTNNSFATWSASAGEVGSVFETSITLPTITMSTLFVALGVADLAGMYSAMLANRQNNFDVRYTGAWITDWILGQVPLAGVGGVGQFIGLIGSGVF